MDRIEPRPASLLERRLAKGLGLARAAHFMGVHPNTLKAAEAGATPRIDSQQRIAEFYEMTPVDLWPVEESAA